MEIVHERRRETPTKTKIRRLRRVKRKKKRKYGRPTRRECIQEPQNETKRNENKSPLLHLCIVCMPAYSTEYMMTIQKTFASLLWSQSLFYDRVGMYVLLTLCTKRFHFYSIPFSRLKRKFFKSFVAAAAATTAKCICRILLIIRVSFQDTALNKTKNDTKIDEEKYMKRV